MNKGELEKEQRKYKGNTKRFSYDASYDAQMLFHLSASIFSILMLLQ